MREGMASSYGSEKLLVNENVTSFFKASASYLFISITKPASNFCFLSL